MAPYPEPHRPIHDFLLDEESLLLFQDSQKRYVLKSQDSSSTAPTDSVSHLSLAEEEGDEWSSSICSSLWHKYYAALQTRPLLVKSITAFVLLGSADVFAQSIEIIRDLHKDDGSDCIINWYRVSRFGFFGLAGAPWTHYYYAWLDRVLPPTPQPWTWTTAVKVIVDQFLQAPALLAVMIMGMALMEGRGIDGICQDMQSEYRTALIKNWELWIPATVVNIAFVKPDLRVLYDNLVFFFWTIFLSMLLNQPVSDP